MRRGSWSPSIEILLTAPHTTYSLFIYRYTFYLFITVTTATTTTTIVTTTTITTLTTTTVYTAYRGANKCANQPCAIFATVVSWSRQECC